MPMKNWSSQGWMLISALVLLTGCTNRQKQSVKDSDVFTIDHNLQGESQLRKSANSIEAWAAQVGAQWSNSTQEMWIDKRVPEGFTPVERFEFVGLLNLPDAQLHRIKSLGISGSIIEDSQVIDFSRFTSLVKLSVADTNLDTLKGLEHTPIQSLGISGVPLRDISLISKLAGLKALGLGPTGATELNLDLSHLTDLETVNLVNPGLKSIEGILTIPNPFTLSLVGDYNKLPIDIGALRAVINSKAKGIYMHQENEEMYGEPLQEIVEEARKQTPDFFLSGFGP